MQIFLLKKKINIDHDADEPIRVSSAAELGEGWGGGSGMISIWRRSRQTSKERSYPNPHPSTLLSFIVS